MEKKVLGGIGVDSWVVIPDDPSNGNCELHTIIDVELKGVRKVRAERFGDSTIRTSHKVQVIPRAEALRLVAEYEAKCKADEEAAAAAKARRAAKDAQATALAGLKLQTSWGAEWSVNDRAELQDEYGNFMDFVPAGVITADELQTWFVQWVADRDAEGWEGVGD